MDSRYVHIIVVHLVIWLISWGAGRLVPQLKGKHYLGIYFILMPLGFASFGWDLAAWFLAAMAVVGLALLFTAFRTALRREAGAP